MVAVWLDLLYPCLQAAGDLYVAYNGPPATDRWSIDGQTASLEHSVAEKNMLSWTESCLVSVREFNVTQ